MMPAPREFSGPLPYRLTAWLVGHAPGAVPPLTHGPLAGGNSNVTILLADAAGLRMVLRRPPAGTALDTAHDVLREARILSALGRAGTPVPGVIATCDDRAVAGVPFMVMRYVDGISCHGAEDARSLEGRARRAAGESLVR